MSDILEPSKIVLDEKTKKQVEAAGKILENLDEQVKSLEDLGFVMTPLRTQIQWAKRARERILTDFT